MDDNHSTKKFRNETGTGVSSGNESARSEKFSHKLSPSPVVHVRGLPENVRESDIEEAVMNFGHVSCVMQIPNKNMALIEFEDMVCATNLVNHAQNNTIFIGTKPALFNYSTSTRIKRPEQSFGSTPNSVILLTIGNAKHPITVDVIHAVTRPFGNVLRIVIFKKNGVQSMIEYDSVDSAAKAVEGLQGQDIYSECCSIKSEFAKPSTLRVRRNDSDSWDFTLQMQDERGDPSQSFKNQPLLADPRFGAGPAPFGPGGFPMFNPMMGFNPAAYGYGFNPGCGGMAPCFSGDSGNYAQQSGMSTGGGAGGGYQQYGSSHGNYQQQSVGQGSYQQHGAGQGDLYQQLRGGRDMNAGSQTNAGSNHPLSAAALMNAYESQSMANTSGSNPDCVLMIYGMDPVRFNCQHLFNLLCIYGNVIRMKFLKNKEGSAMVQMGDRESCDRVIRNLNGAACFGNKLAISISKQSHMQVVVSPHELPDGTSAYADFVGSKNQRYNGADPVSKNRPVQPTSLLYFYNAPPNVSEEVISKAVTDAGAPPPMKVRIFPPKSEKSSRGLLQWSSIESCTDALVVANHAEIYVAGGNRGPFVLKLAFSLANLE